MIEILIESKKFNCKFSICQKVTIIRGHSGRGKTLFTRAISDTSGAYKVKISDNKYSIMALPSVGWYDIIETGINKSLKRIYVIDDTDFICSDEFSHLFVQDKTCFYIIINRFSSINAKSLGRIPFSTEEVYKLIANGREHHLEKFYSYTTSNLSHINIDICITEDSKSGFEFFKTLTNSTLTTDGKDKVLKFLNKHRNELMDKNILLFIDLAAFGSLYDLLYDYCVVNHINITLFKDYYSFEYMLLCSKMVSFDFSNISNEDITHYLSFEQLCEALLKQSTCNKPYSYKKSTLNNCYILDCCYMSSIDKSKRVKCDKGISGNKIRGMLEGTKFAELLCLINKKY